MALIPSICAYLITFYNFFQNLHAYALWSFDGESKSSVPDELRHTADGSTNSENYCVPCEILKTEVIEQHS